MIISETMMNFRNSTTAVSFCDFSSMHAEVGREINIAIQRVFERDNYILGQEVSAFEEELAVWLGVENVIGVGCGTDALVLALLALDVKAGDEVITTDLTAFPTIAAILQIRAVPIPVDINSSTGLISSEQICDAITGRTKGIIPVHLYGRSCDMTSISKIARNHGLWVIEDCAQSIGAYHAGRVTGSFGSLAAFSFYPTKNLGAYGDAGAVVCTDSKQAKRLQGLRNYGQTSSKKIAEAGINSRLDELQAAILRVKLKHLKKWTARRCHIAERYREFLPEEILPSEHPIGENVHHLFPILVPARTEFRRHLQSEGVDSLVHYSCPVHRQPVLTPMPEEHFPETNKWCDLVVSLPLHPHLTEDVQDQIIKATMQALRKSRTGSC